VPRKVLNAYEKLFFNGVDRMQDTKYIQAILYPRTRLVESDPQHTQNESLDQLIMRSAYNHGDRYIDHIMGGADMFASKDSAREFAEKLEASLMANGIKAKSEILDNFVCEINHSAKISDSLLNQIVVFKLFPHEEICIFLLQEPGQAAEEQRFLSGS
jgi:hypothetical protein